jgi:hypothetical protein
MIINQEIKLGDTVLVAIKETETGKELDWKINQQ